MTIEQQSSAQSSKLLTVEQTGDQTFTVGTSRPSRLSFFSFLPIEVELLAKIERLFIGVGILPEFICTTVRPMSYWIIVG